MSDVDRMIAAAAANKDIPILGQSQKQIMNGLNINGMNMTIVEIEQLPEREFRELMLAVIINLVGGVYAPPIGLPQDEPTDEDEDVAASPEEEEPNQGAALDNDE